MQVPHKRAMYIQAPGAQPVTVHLTVETGTLLGLSDDGTKVLQWPLSVVVVKRQAKSGSPGILSVKHQPSVQVLLSHDVMRVIMAQLPPGQKFVVLDSGIQWRWMAGLAGVMACVLGGLYVSIPLMAGAIAPAVPDSWMAELGDSSLASEVGQNKCTHTPGIDAFNVMLTDLVPNNDAAEYPMQITVINEPTINAYAMPGNHIVFFQGLIEAAETPEEIAGILAHEIGHHQANHIKERLVSQAGLSLIAFAITGTDGGILATLGLQFASLSYSRSDEREADALAVDLLEHANISPSGLKTFFERLAYREAENGGPLEILSTHPDSEERAQSIVHRPEGEYKPALPEVQWQALQRVCES